MKCKELSRLTKASHLSSILFRKQCPASSSAIQPLQKIENVLDPSHPGVNLPRKFLPRFHCGVLSVTATPFGLLEPESIPCQPPFDIPVETWAERISRSLSDAAKNQLRAPVLVPVRLPKFQKRGRLSMSLVTVVGKKATSKRKVVRLRIINKLKNTFNLATTRAAEVEDGKLVLDQAMQRQDLICRGWTYTVYPSLEVYRMPFIELVPTVLQALRTIHKKIVDLENSWARKSFQIEDYRSSTRTLTQPTSVDKTILTLSVEKIHFHDRKNRRLLDKEMNELRARLPVSFGERSSKSSSLSSGIASSLQAAPQSDLESLNPRIDTQSNFRSAESGVEWISQLSVRLGSTTLTNHSNEDSKFSEEHMRNHDDDSLARHLTNSKSVPVKNLLRIRRSREFLVATPIQEKVFSTRPITGNVPKVKEKFRYKDSVSHRDRHKRELEKSIALGKAKPANSTTHGQKEDHEDEEESELRHMPRGSDRIGI